LIPQKKQKLSKEWNWINYSTNTLILLFPFIPFVVKNVVNYKSMKLGRPFNKLSFSEYLHFIKSYKMFSDFNTLGLYRSIVETEKLTLEQKIEVRDFAHTFFQKQFGFLQLKDPMTYIAVSTLGQELTKPDEMQLWENVKKNQQKILSDKKIKHRNFGTYSKHICGHEGCPYEGLMTQKGSYFAYHNGMAFESDKTSFGKVKSDKFKKERKEKRLIIKSNLDE
jgi:hypothetical protein